MIRVRSVVPLVAAVASMTVGASVTFGATAATGVGSASPPTEPRPTIPPLTAPSAPVPTTGDSGAPTAPSMPTAPTSAPAAIPQEPTGHQESDGHEESDDAVSPAGRAAILAAMGLDESSLMCVSSAFDPLVTDDAGAVEALQSCGVSIAAVARGAADVWVRGQMLFELTPTTVGAGSDAIPIDDAFFVSFMFMVSPDGLECLARDLPASSTDDEAVAVLAVCDVSIMAIVSGIDMALTTIDAPAPPEAGPSTTPAPPVVGPTTTAGAVPTAPGPNTTVPADPGAPGGTASPIPSGAPLDDPGVPVVQELFAEQGIVLTAEQAACIVGGLTTVDTDNMASMAVLLDSCQVL